jgi:hypothetical protein
LTRNGRGRVGSYIGQLRGSRAPYALLSDLRREVPASALPALVRWIPNLGTTEPLLNRGRFPRSFASVRTARTVLKPVSLEREVLWAAHVLTTHSEFLSKFAKLRGTLDELLLNGTWDQCDDLLDEIDHVAGYTLFALELRLATLSTLKGADAQNAYTTQLLKSDVSQFVRYFVSHVSQRTQESTDTIRFRNLFSSSIDSWSSDYNAFKTYLRFRIADDWSHNVGSVGAILRMEAISPIVDYYETFIRVATAVLADSTSLVAQFTQPILLLAHSIDDPRLQRLSSFLNSDVTGISAHLPDSQILNVLHHVSKGDYKQALIDLRELTAQKRDELVLRIAAQCCSITSETSIADNSLFGKLLPLYVKLITKEGGIDTSFNELSRLSLNYRFTSYAPELLDFASRQLSAAPLPDPTSARRSFLSSRQIDIANLNCLPDGLKNKVAEYLAEQFPENVAVSAELARLDGAAHSFSMPADASEETRTVVALEVSFAKRDYSTVASLAATVFDSASPVLRRHIGRLHANALLNDGKLDAAIDLITSMCLSDVGAIRMLPLRECIDHLSKSVRRKLAHKLSTSILLDLFTRYVDDRQRELREFTYEDFLLAHSLRRPSDLALSADLHPLPQLIYYLRYVCVPEVMQVSPAFQSSQSLEDERLSICTLLTRLDKANAKVYEREIDEITRRQLIQRGVRQAEQSKISIDLEPLRRWARRTLTESFARVKTLSLVGLEASAKEDSQAREASSGSEQELPELPLENAGSLLINIITSLLHECLHNPRHGLDCYLSMRVRHGALSGQLRSALESEKLITQRKGGSDEYARNEYWLSRLTLPQGVASQLDARLRRFAREYDELIGEFATRRVQIRSSDRPNGLFANEVSNSAIALLALDVHPETSFDSFLDACFDTFSQSLETSLQAVREYVDNTLKPQVNVLFTSLQSEAEQITCEISTPSFDTAIRTAQTRTLQALDVVKDWFRQVNPPPPRTFSLEEIAHIGLQLVKKRSFGFNPRLECRFSEMPDFGDLARFSDMFVILFENVARHSGLNDNQWVAITAELDDPLLKVSFESNVAHGVANDATQDRLERIRRIVADGSFHSGIRSEGGTGLIKLGNILATGDRVSRSKLDFEFTSSDTFRVHVELLIRTVEMEQVDGEGSYESVAGRG